MLSGTVEITRGKVDNFHYQSIIWKVKLLKLNYFLYRIRFETGNKLL